MYDTIASMSNLALAREYKRVHIALSALAVARAHGVTRQRGTERMRIYLGALQDECAERGMRPVTFWSAQARALEAAFYAAPR